MKENEGKEGREKKKRKEETERGGKRQLVGKGRKRRGKQREGK